MIQYTYKGEPVRIVQLVMDDPEATGDEQDFCEYVLIVFDDGMQKSVNSCSLSPDPAFVLMGIEK